MQKRENLIAAILFNFEIKKTILLVKTNALFKFLCMNSKLNIKAINLIIIYHLNL